MNHRTHSEIVGIVVISPHTRDLPRANQRNQLLVVLSVVHQVPEADDLVAVPVLDVVEDALQPFEVTVDVADDRGAARLDRWRPSACLPDARLQAIGGWKMIPFLLF